MEFLEGLSLDTPTLDDHSMYSCSGSLPSDPEDVDLPPALPTSLPPTHHGETVEDTSSLEMLEGSTPDTLLGDEEEEVETADNLAGCTKPILLPQHLELEIRVMKGSDPLGLTVECVDDGLNGMRVADIAENGAFWRDSRMSLGDYVVSLNNENFRRITQTQARAILMRTQLLSSDITVRYIPRRTVSRYRRLALHTGELTQQTPVIQISPRSPYICPGPSEQLQFSPDATSRTVDSVDCVSDRESDNFVDCESEQEARTGGIRPSGSGNETRDPNTKHFVRSDTVVEQEENNSASTTLVIVDNTISKTVADACDESEKANAKRAVIVSTLEKVKRLDSDEGVDSISGSLIPELLRTTKEGRSNGRRKSEFESALIELWPSRTSSTELLETRSDNEKSIKNNNFQTSDIIFIESLSELDILGNPNGRFGGCLLNSFEIGDDKSKKEYLNTQKEQSDIIFIDTKNKSAKIEYPSVTEIRWEGQGKEEEGIELIQAKGKESEGICKESCKEETNRAKKEEGNQEVEEEDNMTVTQMTTSVLFAKHWGPERTVEILREPNCSLGISIVGGKVDLYNADTECGSAISGIFIKNVLLHSPAGKTQELKTGDRILEVDSIDLRQASHERAVEVIRAAGNPVRFLVQSLVQWSIDSELDGSSHGPIKTGLSSRRRAPAPPSEESLLRAGRPFYSRSPTPEWLQGSDGSRRSSAQSLRTANQPPANLLNNQGGSSSEDSDEDDTRDMEGRIHTAKGIEISRASAGNVRRNKEEILADLEEEDIFGYTSRSCTSLVYYLSSSVPTISLVGLSNGIHQRPWEVFIQHSVGPAVCIDFDNNLDNIEADNGPLFLQQDGVPPHHSNRVREALNSRLVDWKSRPGLHEVEI